MTDYAFAPDVEAVAQAVLADVADHELLLEHAESVPIFYVWRLGKPQKRHGRTVLGTASKVGGRNAFLITGGEHASVFVIEISKREWDLLEPPGRRALVDHELMHCTLEFDDAGGLKLAIRGHDVEEFFGIVRRHGLWKADIEQMAVVTAEQLRMDLDRVTGEILTDGGGA